MDALSPILHAILKDVAPLRDWEQHPNEPFSFRIQFAGYLKGTPAMADRQISFWRDKCCITDTKNSFPALPGDYTIVGSELVADIVASSGNQFLQYKTPGLTKLKKNDGSISQKEAIDAGREYIKACMTQEAIIIDPNCCNSIGGDIQAATLKADGNFEKWVEVPFNPSA